MELFLLSVLIAYTAGLLLLSYPQKARAQGEYLANSEALSLTVVVSVRNNSEGIVRLLSALPSNVPVIIIDDYSTIPLALPGQSNLTLLHNSGKPGKKRALAQAAVHAQTEFLLFTDSDCVPALGWATHIQHILTQSNAEGHPVDLLVLPVWIEGGSFFARLQSMEFATVMFLTKATGRWSKPIMANGANLACCRSKYLAFLQERTDWDIPSGDDMFLLQHAMAAGDWRVITEFSPEALVKTDAVPTLSGFWRQRLRWAGKWKHYAPSGPRWQAAAVWTLHALIMVSYAWAFKCGSMLLLFALGMKAALETRLIYTMSKSLKQPFFLAETLFLQIVYSPYVVAVGLVSTLRGK